MTRIVQNQVETGEPPAILALEVTKAEQRRRTGRQSRDRRYSLRRAFADGDHPSGSRDLQHQTYN
jgi:hypothetical protein